MKKNNGNNHNLLGGLLIAALIGAGGAILLHSRLGKKWKSDLSDLCDDVKEFTCDLAEKTGDMSREMAGHLFKKNPINPTNIIIGGVAGGILGLSAVLLLSAESSKEFRKILNHTFCSLTDKACDFAEDIEERAEDAVEELEERITYWVKTIRKLIDNLNVKTSKKGSNVSLDKFVAWTSIGLQLLQSLRK